MHAGTSRASDHAGTLVAFTRNDLITRAEQRFPNRSALSIAAGTGSSNITAFVKGRAIPFHVWMRIAAVSCLYPDDEQGLMTAIADWAAEHAKTRIERDRIMAARKNPGSWVARYTSLCQRAGYSPQEPPSEWELTIPPAPAKVAARTRNASRPAAIRRRSAVANRTV